MEGGKSKPNEELGLKNSNKNQITQPPKIYGKHNGGEPNEEEKNRIIELMTMNANIGYLISQNGGEDVEGKKSAPQT